MTGWPRLPSPDFDIDPDSGPRSILFNDGYASPAGAAAETETVFLDGIGAPSAWRDRPTFAIGETGFGLGLNFLMTWALWRRTAMPDACLHYVSVEGYPLDQHSLTRALQLYRDIPGLASLIDEICDRFPLRHAGFHRLSLDGGRVQLTLLFGPVEHSLSQLSGKMDAWYLDGFAPARNPDMWTAPVFRAIACRTKPGGRFATYTAAGHVRRGLEDVGFSVEKHPGFAHKRERLTGTLATPPDDEKAQTPWFSLPPTPADPGEVAIIGGGIAAQCCWHALKARGIEATLFDRAGPAGGMGANPVAMIAPKLPVNASLPGRLNALTFLKALAFYDGLGPTVWYDPRGAMQAAAEGVDSDDRQARLIDALDWPKDLITVTEVAGRSALSYPASGCLDPQAVRNVIGAPVESADINALIPIDGGWRLMDGDCGEVWSGRRVIVAAGGWTGRLLQAPWLEIRPSRGQVSWIKGDALPAGIPEQGIGFGGYLSPNITLRDGRRGRVLGSSFDAWPDPDGDTGWQVWSHDDHQRYAAEFAQVFSQAFDLSPPPAEAGWTGLRAMTGDRLPIAGPMPDAEAYGSDYGDLHHGRHWVDYPPARYRDGLYVLSGLGARGYQFSPLMAELLADMLAGMPLPLEKDLIEAVHPARFLIREMKRAGTP
ncbi:FAD-dependent oxidoreductase [Hwanghaeella grinnelliae]|uniref:tRNA 5-methylaminomethyl-2-thiouridine biosynthesis bifunctional protein MnmC n=1 Tax=Hwanghaeella grinnelliae TaxID=2500179 RepID=A0A437QW63_9PROT|nr:FAD-dependent 5-carboxymethylaminomethyl-2-thiouridine(34) oxidoreductase MnmC [Hwanghaeella grinnelliae]RVU38770.1 FAD-dependent oxidoreductase [Hwanghaeella grinnelliae]